MNDAGKIDFKGIANIIAGLSDGARPIVLSKLEKSFNVSLLAYSHEMDKISYSWEVTTQLECAIMAIPRKQRILKAAQMIDNISNVNN